MIKKAEYFMAVHELIKTGHWITHQVSAALKPMGVTEPQYNVLRILQENGDAPMTVLSIQQEMVQPTSNVTRIIDKLLDGKFVNRQECSENRRKMDITLTPTGKKFLEQLDEKVHAFHEPMTKNLTLNEAKTLRELIKKLKEA